MNAQKFKKIMAEVRSEMNKISDIQEELFYTTIKAALIKEDSDAYFHAWDYLYNSKNDEHFAKTSMDNLLKALKKDGHKITHEF